MNRRTKLRGPDLIAGARIARSLILLLHRPSTIEAAKALIRGRMTARGEQFLTMVRKTIWPYPRSPYRRLLERGDWSPERLEEAVRQRGLDGTLRALLDDGVYLSLEELKGRQPIRRNGLVLEHEDSDFNNPTIVPSYEVRTGGTRSEGSRVPSSLEYLASQRAPTRVLMLEALGVSAQPVILWHTRDAGVSWWLALSHFGRPPIRWFSLTDLSAFAIPQLHAMMFAFARTIGLARGLRLPPFEYAPLSGVATVLEAVLGARARYGHCVLITTPSAATRLAALASDSGRDLARVTVSVTAEPLTPGKYAEIARAGAHVTVHYGMTELGSVASACGRPDVVDEVHFMADSFGLVCEQRALPDGEKVDALFMTTLQPTSPKILINVDTDDFARVTHRECGCLWHELGLNTHLNTVRSFSKFKGEGAMVLGTDCVRILEEVLPREFGGRSTDYQLLEAEDEYHQTRLYLVVSPSVGVIDERRVRARFIEELRHPTSSQSSVPPLWRQADTIAVVRREPVVTAAGKLLPFHTLAAASRGSTPLRQPRTP